MYARANSNNNIATWRRARLYNALLLRLRLGCCSGKKLIIKYILQNVVLKNNTETISTSVFHYSCNYCVQKKFYSSRSLRIHFYQMSKISDYCILELTIDTFLFKQNKIKIYWIIRFSP